MSKAVKQPINWVSFAVSKFRSPLDGATSSAMLYISYNIDAGDPP